MKIFIFSAFLLSLSFLSIAQTNGEVHFSIKTISTKSGFSPNHVFAMWVEDNNNKLVKNLEVDANKRIQYLYTWNKASGGSATDINSGATLSNHTTHTKTWNCLDKSGNLVPDGDYKIITEFTSEHAQGPLNIVSFNKGAEKITLNPTSSTYFSDMELIYTPAATSINPGMIRETGMEIYPNPSAGKFVLKFNIQDESLVKFKLYTINFQLIRQIHSGKFLTGPNTINFDIGENLSSGTYILVMECDRFIATRKIIIEK